jgi:hypothetical protein
MTAKCKSHQGIHLGLKNRTVNSPKGIIKNATTHRIENNFSIDTSNACVSDRRQRETDSTIKTSVEAASCSLDAMVRCLF